MVDSIAVVFRNIYVSSLTTFNQNAKDVKFTEARKINL